MVVSLTSHRKLVTGSTVQYLVTVDRPQLVQFSGSILSVVRHGNKTTDRDLIVQYWPGHSRSITIRTVSVGQNHYINQVLASSQTSPENSSLAIDSQIHSIIVDPQIQSIIVDPQIQSIIVDPQIQSIIVDPQIQSILDPRNQPSQIRRPHGHSGSGAASSPLTSLYRHRLCRPVIKSSSSAEATAELCSPSFVSRPSPLHTGLDRANQSLSSLSWPPQYSVDTVPQYSVETLCPNTV